VSGIQPRYSRRDLLRDVGISLLCAGLIVALPKLGVLQPGQGCI
jgi:hypothetical protein